jgi:phage shock protein C
VLALSTRPAVSTATRIAITLRLGLNPSLAEGGAMDSTRKLYRSKTDRVLAGVCGGLAQYFNLDATLIRVLFVLLAVLGGSGLDVAAAVS